MFDLTYFQMPESIGNTEKIERLVKSDDYKHKLRDDIAPLNVHSKQRPSRSFILTYIEQFANELNQKSSVVANLRFDVMIKKFLFTSKNILELGPSRISVQIISQPGIYFYANIKDSSLHIDLNFNEETGNFDEAVVNIFENKTQKLNAFGSVEDIFSEIRSYFHVERQTNYDYNARYAISVPGQTSTAFAF